MYFEKCNEDQLKKIYDEINVTEESLQKDVAYLKDWLQKQPHLPNLKDDRILKIFLLRCKNSLEKTKTKLDMYYSGRAILSDVFTNRDPGCSENRRSIYTASFTPHPSLTSDGDRIMFFHVFDPINVDFITLTEYMKANYMVWDISLKDDVHRKTLIVWDVQNMSLNLATHAFKGAKKVSSISKELSPFRILKILVINMNPMFATIFSLAATFINKKTADTVEYYSDDKVLSRFIPVDMLPSNYGGKGKSLEELRDQFYAYLVTQREWFISEDNVKADLSKRTDDRFKEILMHGVEGSFRKLDVD